jgi:hypothetical protein
MNYEIITIGGVLDAPDTEHVIITREDGSMESFPVDETNPRYIQFLAELEEQA